MVGARSALFLPYADLGLIIVDEEHDQAYKQDDGAHYHARDMAVVRAHIAKIPIVLASATPSVETEVNARKGRYQRVALPSRFGGQHMPHIEAIDLRRAPPPRGRFISPPLAEADSVRDREARAGAAVPQPPRLCAADIMPRLRPPLRLHHLRRLAGGSPFSPAPGLSSLRLLDPRPNICPHCQAGGIAGRDRPRRRAPAGRGGRAVSECAHHGAVERPHHLDRDHAQRAQRNREGRVDIIVGTQLVAKGHHFPRLNLVGVVDADLGLGNGDPRAAERTFQLLNQVIGRAGASRAAASATCRPISRNIR